MLRRLKDEQGIALVVALGIMVVMAIAVTSAIQFTTSNTRAASNSQVRVSARQVAEAGMNAAIASIQADPTNAASLPAQGNARTLSVNGGTATYWGSWDTTTSKWTIYSNGAVQNAASGSNTSMPLKATVQVDPSPLVQSTPPASSNPWAFMWSTRTGNACDETLTTQISAPIVVQGTLCITQPGATQVGMVNGWLHVKGSYVNLTGTNAKASKTASYSAISGGTHLATGTQCKNSYASATLHACSGSIATGGDNLAGFDRSVTGINPVVADFDHWYASGAPGPYHGCNTSLSTGNYSFLVFENESSGQTRNNSMNSGSPLNLTPQGSAYDCVVGSASSGSGWCSQSGGGSYGEIKWDGTKNFEVRGTVYFDGSVSMSNASLITDNYTCYGSIYTSGTILLKNMYMCAKYLDNTCSGATGFFSGWWPFANWLFLVADGDGANGGASSQSSQVGSGDGIKFINSRFQGGMYATKAIHLDANSGFEGPAIAGNLTFDGNYTSVWGTNSWQSGNTSSVMPTGTPGISQSSKTQVEPPVYG